MDTKNKKLYPGEGIMQKQKGKQLKAVEMPYYAKRKDTKKFLKEQFRKQKQAEQEQQQMLENVTSKRQRQLFGERQTMPTNPALLQAMAARQAAIPGQEDIMKETFLQKLMTPQEFQKYKEDKAMKKTKTEQMERIPQQQLQALQNILATQPQQLQTLQNILAKPGIDMSETENLLKQLRALSVQQRELLQSQPSQQSKQTKTDQEYKDEFRKLEETNQAQFIKLLTANNIQYEYRQGGVKINTGKPINELIQKIRKGTIVDLPPAMGAAASPKGSGLFKKGRKKRDLEGEGFFGDLFRSAKDKIVEAVKSDPIAVTKKAFELAQKGIKGAQEAKKMATQFGLIKPKPATAPAPSAEQAKGSGLKRGRGRPRKNIKGGEFGQHLLSTMFHQIADPFIDKGKKFLADPATQQAIGIYKDLTGSGLKKGKNSNAHFKQALEEYKNIQGKQKASRRRVMETM